MIPIGEPAVEPDRGDPNLVQGDLVEFNLLRPFNHAGVLAAADVHTAIRLSRLAGADDDQVALAVALAVRSPRVGHVSVDLADVRASAAEVGDEVDFDLLPWPDPDEWLSRVAASDLVDAGPSTAPSDRPLKLVGTCLYLERYWRDEASVAEEILHRLGPVRTEPVSPGPVGDRLERLFPGAGSDDQLRAARLALSGAFSVIAGGPGTGKTTTVARLLAALFEQAVEQGLRPPLVGLAAPTGKAAARMEEALRAEADRLETGPDVQAALRQVSGSTLHRLLGTRFDRPGRFRHHRGHRLPHDIVVVDEASMVSLSLMASLAEAVRPDARLVLVGDPDQLVSVEAGAVLADIVGPAGRPTPTPPAIAGSISVLRQNHRFAGSLARLSAAVQAGDDARALDLLSGGDPALAWIDADPGDILVGGRDLAPSDPLAEMRARAVAWGTEVTRLAAGGEASAALAALRRHRILCAHRRGAAGVGAWNRVIGEWVSGDEGPAVDDDLWYAGRPVMVTANDYSLRLFNGDSGVAVAWPDDEAGRGATRLAVAFDEGAARAARMVSPTRLHAIETVYAMTVHKSQGSEFDRVTILLPAAGSRLLTRQLLYTAITRARVGVTVVGTAEAVAAAVRTPIARASGLGRRLWGDAAV